MSLINQMLQDLERRSAGNMVGASAQEQVRAVPDRSGLHPAWWLVLVLTCMLTAVIAWFSLRTAPPPVALPTLALKIAPDLSALPSPVAQTPRVEQDRLVDAAPTISNPSMGVAAPEIEMRPRIEANVADATTKRQKKESLTTPEAAPELSAKSLEATVATKSAVAHSGPISNGDANKSIKLNKEVKELTPQQRAENSYRQAGTALQLGRNTDAISNLEQALQFDPQHAAARQMLVGVLLQAKRTDDAIHQAQEGLALDPAQFGLAMILARIQVEQNDLKAAITTLDHSAAYAQDRADYQAFFGALLQRDKRHKEAINHYVIAIGKAPQNGIWWMGLGISLQAEDRLPEAKEAFNRAKSTNTLTPELLAFVNQKLTQFP
jgi:MSHA biogenesis protein MshN